MSFSLWMSTTTALQYAAFFEIAIRLLKNVNTFLLSQFSQGLENFSGEI